MRLSALEKAIYVALRAAGDRGLTILELRAELGVEGQQHLDRRLRSLDTYFEINREKDGQFTRYRLVRQLENPRADRGTIRKQDRAWALRLKRCSQCGRTPDADGVRLHVDHKVPLTWGGTNDRENLQALCSECNEGKRDLYASFGEHATEIALAIAHEEPHRRIGELLKAFDGRPVPDDVLDIVANAKQPQKDWEKRLRELRVLGWNYTFSKRKEGRRVRTYFTLTQHRAWPEDETIAAAIRRHERESRRARSD